MPQVCPLPPPSHAKLLLPAQTPTTPTSSGIDHIFRADSPHYDHASQVLSCSFKNAAPMGPGTGNAQNRNSSSGNLIPYEASDLVGSDW